MSTAAVMLAKDEIDVVEDTLRHLAGEVDEILVADNGSTDGTRERLEGLELLVPLRVSDDPEVAYLQSAKTTALAMEALSRGHSWVVPCDADEVWYAPDGRRIADYLAGLAPDVMIVKADLYDHVPTAFDPRLSSPLRRIRWRKRNHGALPKVACRLRPDLTILAGNHGAATSGTALAVPGLTVRHFSWRSEDQYARKIRNGALAYLASGLPSDVGAHWRMHGHPDATDFEDRVREHFRTWFWSADPEADDSLIFDAATPILRG